MTPQAKAQAIPEDSMTKPLAIDLFCGLGGWTEGLLAQGWDVVGFDIVRHVYGEDRYPAQLVVQDVLTLHGSQFKGADLIVASPPCQEYSYMAMPWGRAKQIARALRGEDDFPEGYAGSRTTDELTALFNACFRLQREACQAAGRHIPLVVENVKGAQSWVGRAAWNFGSYYLWGDVPALMPVTAGGHKSSGMNWSDQSKRGQDFTRIAGRQAMDGRKRRDQDGYERDHPAAFGWKSPRTSSGATTARKHASAMIAKIPGDLSRHIAAVYRPTFATCGAEAAE